MRILLTVKVAILEEILPLVALILLEPALTPVANPVLLIIAAGLLDNQVNVPKVAGVPSVRTPLAVNCFVLPTAMLADEGEIVIETKTGADTLNCTELEVTT